HSIAAPENNFEYIDFPGTEYFTELKDGYVFHMLDGRDIYLDENGDITDDIVGVTGQNVFYFKNSENEYEINLYNNSNKLIDTLSSNMYDVSEKNDYIAVLDKEGSTENREIKFYSKKTGEVLSHLPFKNYGISNTYDENSGYDIAYLQLSKSGLFVFKNPEGLCGISDIYGNIILQPKYKMLSLCDFEKDYYTIKNDGILSVINEKGEVIKKVGGFSNISRCSENEEDIIRYCAFNEGKLYPLDKNFNLVFNFNGLEYRRNYGNDSILVSRADDNSVYDTPMGLVDFNGKTLLPMRYSSFEDIGGGLIKAHQLDNYYHFIITDRKGNILAQDCD
ncbi:MAG: WG repeat-containing protein, partial [Bacillota bacterium]|nr:WG repeat-containing protein [Bacillota bacterium]